MCSWCLDKGSFEGRGKRLPWRAPQEVGLAGCGGWRGGKDAGSSSGMREVLFAEPGARERKECRVCEAGTCEPGSEDSEVWATPSASRKLPGGSDLT